MGIFIYFRILISLKFWSSPKVGTTQKYTKKCPFSKWVDTLHIYTSVLKTSEGRKNEKPQLHTHSFQMTPQFLSGSITLDFSGRFSKKCNFMDAQTYVHRNIDKRPANPHKTSAHIWSQNVFCIPGKNRAEKQISIFPRYWGTNRFLNVRSCFSAAQPT